MQATCEKFVVQAQVDITLVIFLELTLRVTEDIVQLLLQAEWYSPCKVSGKIECQMWQHMWETIYKMFLSRDGGTEGKKRRDGMVGQREENKS